MIENANIFFLKINWAWKLLVYYEFFPQMYIDAILSVFFFLCCRLDPIQSGPPQPKAKKRPLPETSESSPSGKKAKHKAPPVNDTRDSDSEEESEDDMMEQNGSAGTEEGSDAEDESHSDTSDEEQEAEKKNFTKVKTKDSKKAKKTKHKMTTNGKSVASKVSVQQQSQKHKKMKGKKKWISLWFRINFRYLTIGSMITNLALLLRGMYFIALIT